jgi:hypothetical protein
MRFTRHYDLRKTNTSPRWGFVFTPKIKGKNKSSVPANLDVFLGNHLFAFWGKKMAKDEEIKRRFKTWTVDEPRWSWPKFYKNEIDRIYFEWVIAGRLFYWGYY